MRKLKILALILLTSFCGFAQNGVWTDFNKNGQEEVYERASETIDTRVDDLIKRMTLEEKVGQMCQYIGWREMKQAEGLQNEDLKVSYEFSVGNAMELVKQGKIGSFLFVQTQEDCNVLQKASLESRLGIPLLMAIDAIHGNGMTNEGGTVYPTEVGLAATFDTDLVEKIAAQTAAEMRSIGYHWTFSPNIEVVYDYRWGRCGETFGEDPYLVGKMGAAMIRGYQGTDFSKPNNVLACAKHFVGGGIAVNGFNGAPADISERTLREEFFPPFQEAINNGVYSIMPAHNEINGIPCHMHNQYLTNLVRKKWGFEGFYVSDWMDLEKLHSIQRTVSSHDEAFEKSVNAGLDIHMHGPEFLESVVQHVQQGRIPLARVEEAARLILRAKFQLGLFENRFVNEETMKKTVLKEKHQDLALQAAQKSIVLLKNENHTLPLKKDLKKIFVTGTLADNQAILGDWAIPRDGEMVVTPLEGIQNKVSKKTQVDFLDQGPIFQMKDELIAQSKERAANADVCVLVVGEHGQRNQNPNHQTLGENVDRPVLHLRGKQRELVKAVAAAGKPVVLVLVNGGPIAVNWAAENVDAIIEAWEPGMKGGQALADILFGDISPSGRMPFSVARSVGHLYAHYKLKPSSHARGEFLDSPRTALYPFGFGMSFSQFEFSHIQHPDTINVNEGLTVKFKVKNTGAMQADEVVMLYVNDVFSSVATPIKELVAFKRINLKSGETKEIELTISNKQLSFLDKNMNRTVEPGEFELFLEGSNGQQIKRKFYAKPN